MCNCLSLGDFVLIHEEQTDSWKCKALKCAC